MKTRHLIVLILIVLSIAACYHHTFQVPFVFDDIHAIKENEKIRDPGNFLTLHSLTLQRPLTDLTFALNYHFGELNLFGYHLVNTVIHIITSILVYILALIIFRRFSGSGIHASANCINIIIPAAFAALVFALHPVQTQAVTYIVQRYTSMSAMFYIGAVLFYVLGRMAMISPVTKPILGISSGSFFLPLKTFLYFVLCLFFALASFLSKQIALSLPLAIMFMEYALFDQTWEGWKKKLLCMVPVFALFVGFVLYSTGVLQGDISLGRLLEETDQRTRETMDITRLQYLFTQFQVMAIYLSILVWPVNLSLDYMYPVVEKLFEIKTMLSLAFLLLLTGGAIWFRKSAPLLFIAVFWFFITLSVESSIIPISDALFEHRLYLPMMGFALLLGWLCHVGLVNKASITLICVFLLLIFLSLITYQRNITWQSPLDLWEDTVSKRPDNPRAHNNYGFQLNELDPLPSEEAAIHYHKAVDLDPEYADALYNLGRYYLLTDDLHKALGFFEQAVDHNSEFAHAYYYVGYIHELQQNGDEAAKFYHKALDIDQDHYWSGYRLALQLMENNDFSQAMDLLLRNIESTANHVPTRMALAQLYIQLENYPEALKHLNHVLGDDPQDTSALFTKGVVLYNMGMYAQARDTFRRVFEIDPQHTTARDLFFKLLQVR